MGMSNPFFSIIIPTHNAEPHIRKCLESIAQQSFKDYELIVVCDCCTDNTEKIAKSYGAITQNVRFRNDGPTRDVGIEIAKGEWVLFIDDDDWYLHEYVFQQLVDVLGTQNEDVLSFGYVWKGRGYTPPTYEDIFKPRVSRVWSKAWKRSAIGDARFGNAVFSADTYFLKAMKNRNPRTALFDMPLYYYNFLRPGSQTDLFCKGQIRQSPVAE